LLCKCYNAQRNNWAKTPKSPGFLMENWIITNWLSLEVSLCLLVSVTWGPFRPQTVCDSVWFIILEASSCLNCKKKWWDSYFRKYLLRCHRMYWSGKWNSTSELNFLRLEWLCFLRSELTLSFLFQSRWCCSSDVPKWISPLFSTFWSFHGIQLQSFVSY